MKRAFCEECTGDTEDVRILKYDCLIRTFDLTVGSQFITFGSRLEHAWITFGARLVEHVWVIVGSLLYHFWITFGAL
eukprot:12770784-Heterocapsa_arctica.AAC.1